MFCAGSIHFMKKSSHICKGDSGGPAVDFANGDDGELVGIVAFGYPCYVHYPGVFTNVINYRDWIEKIILTNDF